MNFTISGNAFKYCDLGDLAEIKNAVNKLYRFKGCEIVFKNLDVSCFSQNNIIRDIDYITLNFTEEPEQPKEPKEPKEPEEPKKIKMNQFEIEE